MLNRAAGFVGEVLSGLFRAILFVRRPRPIHARGRVLLGEISWIAGAATSGIRWIDEPTEHPVPVVARLSRSVGLPAALPDIIGLALRTDAGGRPVDIELRRRAWASLPDTCCSRTAPRRARATADFSLVSSRPDPRLRPPPHAVRAAAGRGHSARRGARAGAMAVAAAPRDADGKVASVRRSSLRLDEDQDDTSLRFDSVRHALPGADTYPWVRALRQPSYHLAQDAPVRQRRG